MTRRCGPAYVLVMETSTGDGAATMSAEWTGWDRRESGPGDAPQTALLLPGGMCTAVQYEELMAEPALANVRLVAVTMPGMGHPGPGRPQHREPRAAGRAVRGRPGLRRGG